MAIPPPPRRSYLRRLDRAAPETLKALRRECGLPRLAAAEAYSAIAALSLAGLARRQRDRPEQPRAAVEAARELGRPADLDAPEMGIIARAQAEAEGPRLGGLLGDAGARTGRWVALRTGADPEAVERAFVLTAPLPLGACAALAPRDLQDWVSSISDRLLDDPDVLLEPGDECAETFRSLRRRGLPWWVRVLGLRG